MKRNARARGRAIRVRDRIWTAGCAGLGIGGLSIKMQDIQGPTVTGGLEASPGGPLPPAMFRRRVGAHKLPRSALGNPGASSD